MKLVPKPELLRALRTLHCRYCQSLQSSTTCRSYKKCSFIFPRRHYSDSTVAPWMVHELKSRGVIQLKGPNVKPFLQGLVTNDVTHLGDQCKAQYAMMLNVQGRVLYDLIIYDTSEKAADALLIECDRSVTADILKTLKMYKLRKKVDMSDVSNEYAVFAALPSADKNTNIWELDNLADLPIAAQDPRVNQFGWRIVSPNEKSLVDSFKSESDIKMQPEELYHEARYRLGISEGITDLPPGNCFPLESNLVYMNGVCFAKGCYIGQELTARTHHTGVTRKRLMPLVFENPPKGLNPGDGIVTGSGKTAGRFRNSVGKYGLGLMRLANITGQLTVTGDGDVKYIATAHVPSWWPADEVTEHKN